MEEPRKEEFRDSIEGLWKEEFRDCIEFKQSPSQYIKSNSEYILRVKHSKMFRERFCFTKIFRKSNEKFTFKAMWWNSVCFQTCKHFLLHFFILKSDAVFFFLKLIFHRKWFKIYTFSQTNFIKMLRNGSIYWLQQSMKYHRINIYGLTRLRWSY